MKTPYEYTLGEVVRVEGVFKTTLGGLINPAIVKCIVEDPAGVITTYVYGSGPEVVNDGLGTYHCDLITDSVGWWYYRWESSGSGQAAGKSRFRVTGYLK